MMSDCGAGLVIMKGPWAGAIKYGEFLRRGASWLRTCGGISEMRSIKLATLALSLAATMPALADEFFAVTPSGAAETLFPEDSAAVIGKLSSKCIDAKWTVISSSGMELMCEAPLNMGQSVLGQMLMGNSYSTPPRRFFRFNVAKVNGVSRVQASGWMELQMAFGQMKRTDFSGPEFQNGMVDFMLAAGGKLPRGTTFPNHVTFGIKAEPATIGKYAGLRVISLDPGGAAEAAGIEPGDIISSVSNKRFKNTSDWLDALALATKSPEFPAEVIRAGKPIKVSVPRRYRAVIDEDVTPTGKAEAVAVAGAGPLVADELAKLAKLKSDGVLTGAEFEAAKAKLLAK